MLDTASKQCNVPACNESRVKWGKCYRHYLQHQGLPFAEVDRRVEERDRKERERVTRVKQERVLCLVNLFAECSRLYDENVAAMREGRLSQLVESRRLPQSDLSARLGLLG
jgi:hypothetical protein